MLNESLSLGAFDAFCLPVKASQLTEWHTDPSNPTDSETGVIKEGDQIWLDQGLFGSGPTWQAARLSDNRLCYVHPYHFNSTE